MTSSPLWPHQQAGLERIIADDGVHGLLWGMGSGKSKVAVAYMEHLATELCAPISVLVVCPKSVCQTWHEQVEQHCSVPHGIRTLDGPIAVRLADMAQGHTYTVHADSPSIHIFVVSYPTFSSRKKVGSKLMSDIALKAVADYKPDLVICDEAHALRSPTSNLSRLFKRIYKVAPRRLLLTGTPMPHSPLDVLGQWGFLDPSAFSPPGTDRIVSKTTFEQGYGAHMDQYGQVTAWKDMEDLHERVGRKSSVVRTSEVVDIPELRVVPYVFDLSPAEQRAYSEMKEDLLTVVQDETIIAMNKLVSIMRLRQVTSGFMQDKNEGQYVEVGSTRHDIAVEMVENILASDDRTVIYAWSRPELDRLYATLSKNPPWGGRVERIAGDTSQTAREYTLNKFAHGADKMVLLAQISTLNAGVNSLTRASNVLYLSLTQRTDEWLQSLARFHRPGQRNNVVANVIVARNTVDELQLAAHEGHIVAEKAMLDHIKGVK